VNVYEKIPDFPCEECIWDKVPLNGHMCSGCIQLPTPDPEQIREWTPFPIPWSEVK
jgi:hypothetical protein